MKKILITGGTGLVGNRFCELYKDKYQIHILTRDLNRESKNNIHFHHWDTNKKILDIESILPDYIITLHGTGIADKRWTTTRKKEIIESRILPINLIKEKLLANNHRPKAIIGASAIGYFGNRPGEELNEKSQIGKGFLSESCKEWEEAYQSINNTTDRLVILRLGTVLSKKGGALPKMLMTKFLRIFNYFGIGNQIMSWIHIDDVCGIIDEAISNENYQGIINTVSPYANSNKIFITEIKNTIGKYGLILPVPKFILKLVLGEMAAILLDDANVKPTKLLELNYKYKYLDIKEALRNLISY